MLTAKHYIVLYTHVVLTQLKVIYLVMVRNLVVMAASVYYFLFALDPTSSTRKACYHRSLSQAIAEKSTEC